MDSTKNGRWIIPFKKFSMFKVKEETGEDSLLAVDCARIVICLFVYKQDIEPFQIHYVSKPLGSSV